MSTTSNGTRGIERSRRANARLGALIAAVTTAVLAALTVPLAGPAAAAAATYYVDPVNGDNNAAGTSASTAWRSLGKASAVSLAPGSRLLLKQGTTFSGTLTVASSGTASQPVVIGSYGTGGAPVIANPGKWCISVTGSYVSVQGVSTSGCSVGVGLQGRGDSVVGGKFNDGVTGIRIAGADAVLTGPVVSKNTGVGIDVVAGGDRAAITGAYSQSSAPSATFLRTVAASTSLTSADVTLDGASSQGFACVACTDLRLANTTIAAARSIGSAPTIGGTGGNVYERGGTVDFPILPTDTVRNVGPVAGLKPPLSGLVATVDINGTGSPSVAGLSDIRSVLAGQGEQQFGTIKANWKTLEATQGSYDFSRIDSILSQFPSVKFRIRIKTGIDSPTWMCSLPGASPCIDTTGHTDANSAGGLVPRFWTPQFMARYSALMSAIAARYDANPQVVEVADGACSTAYAEPFILGIKDKVTRKQFYDAGMTPAAQQTCVRWSAHMMAAILTQTRYSLALHKNWQQVAPDGALQEVDFAQIAGVVDPLRADHGQRLVLDEHSLVPNVSTDACAAGASYCYLDRLPDTASPGQPTTKYGFQWKENDRDPAGRYQSALRAATWGACDIEGTEFSFAGSNKLSLHRRLVDGVHCSAA